MASIGKSNGLFHRPPPHPVLGPARPPRATHPGARLARAGTPWMPPAGRRPAPPGQGLGTERRRGWGYAAGGAAGVATPLHAFIYGWFCYKVLPFPLKFT